MASRRRFFIAVVVTGFALGCDAPRIGTSDSPAGAVRRKEQAEPQKQVYDESADARADIDHAIAWARADRKRILLVFGGNWCRECIVLDALFHEPPAKPVVEAEFHVVHVDIGRGSTAKNRDLAKQYEIPLNKGVPAVAVLDSDGRLLHSQKGGEFAPHGLSAATVVDFLNRWRAAGR